MPPVPPGSSKSEATTCLVAGGGPAGMILGLLLARAGVKVTVMEKYGGPKPYAPNGFPS